MRPPPYPEVPDDFGHWLAGFIDGEGSFMITPKNYRPSGGCTYSAYFDINVRADEKPMLDEIMARTGIGWLGGRPAFHATKPQVHWRVSSRPECARLVELLERYPLRAKKRRDFAIWKQAIAVQGAMAPGSGFRGRLPGGEPLLAIPLDWSTMLALKQQLHAVRVYREEG